MAPTAAGQQDAWAFQCVARATVTRNDVASSAVVGEIEPPAFVAVSRIVDDAKDKNARRLYVPELKGWVSEVDGVGRVLFELREPDVQMVALSTRQSLLAFSGGASDPRAAAAAAAGAPRGHGDEAFKQRSAAAAAARRAVSLDLFGMPQPYAQPQCLLEQRAVSTEAFAAFTATFGEPALLAPQPSPALRSLVRDHGVAPGRRRRLWMAWSGAAAMKEARPDGYAALLSKTLDKASVDQIESDLPRTCPEHAWFLPSPSAPIQEAGGIAATRRVLRAFTVDNPSVGYTQSMNFLAAFLLLVFEVDRLKPGGERASEAEEDVFWLLGAVTLRSLRGYHTDSLRGVRVDAKVFDALVEAKLPKLSAHFRSHNIDGLDFVTSRWLLCCFHGILPAEAVARVFDQMLLARHNAPAVLLRIGLAVLVRASDRLLACDCDALLMEELLHSPDGIRTAAHVHKQPPVACDV